MELCIRAGTAILVVAPAEARGARRGRRNVLQCQPEADAAAEDAPRGRPARGGRARQRQLGAGPAAQARQVPGICGRLSAGCWQCHSSIKDGLFTSHGTHDVPTPTSISTSQFLQPSGRRWNPGRFFHTEPIHTTSHHREPGRNNHLEHYTNAQSSPHRQREHRARHSLPCRQSWGAQPPSVCSRMLARRGRHTTPAVCALVCQGAGAAVVHVCNLSMYLEFNPSQACAPAEFAEPVRTAEFAEPMRTAEFTGSRANQLMRHRQQTRQGHGWQGGCARRAGRR